MVKMERFELRIDEATLEQLDEWRAGQPDVPNRSEAARRLINQGLSVDSLFPAFTLTKLHVFAVAHADSANNRVGNAYLFAWRHNIYPFLQPSAQAHLPFSKCFEVSKSMMEELVGYLDKSWTRKETINFYQLEDRYSDGNWDRSTLIDAIRYIYLSKTFADEFWVAFMDGHQHPVEASLMTEPCSDEERNEMIKLG